MQNFRITFKTRVTVRVASCREKSKGKWRDCFVGDYSSVEDIHSVLNSQDWTRIDCTCPHGVRWRRVRTAAEKAADKTSDSMAFMRSAVQNCRKYPLHRQKQWEKRDETPAWSKTLKTKRISCAGLPERTQYPCVRVNRISVSPMA